MSQDFKLITLSLVVLILLSSCGSRKDFDSQKARSMGFPLDQTFITTKDMQIITTIGFPSNKSLVLDGGPEGSKTLGQIDSGTQLKSASVGLAVDFYGQSYFYLMRVETGEYAGWVVAINYLVYPYGFLYKREPINHHHNNLISIHGMEAINGTVRRTTSGDTPP